MKKLSIILGLFVFMQHAPAQNWLITGNSGTSSITNFIGTKDFQALVFRTNNAERMRILTNGNTGIGTKSALQKLDVVGNINIRSGFALFMDNHRVLKVDSVNGNVFLGSAVAPNNSGFYNTANGNYALHNNTTGFDNTASGYASLFANTAGNYNTANGNASLYSNSTGSYNTASGYASLYFNSTGSNNAASGYASLYSNSTGSYNTASGYASLYFNSTGSNNTASGYASLYNNTTGFHNTAIGFSSLSTNTTGFDNNANGHNSLYSNTTGFDNTASGNYALYSNTTGDFNTATGFSSLTGNATGHYNTADGSNALGQNTFGSYNTGIGYAALSATTGANYNTAVGYNAGNFTDNGWNNVFVGANTGVNGTDYYNVVAVGQGTICTAVNQARIGNSFTTSIGGYANWSNISDVRVKKNIKENVPGLAFINKLKAITYNLDLTAADKITQHAAKDKDGKVIQSTQQELAAKKAKEQIIYTGFAAQEVEKAAKELNYDFSGVDAAKNDKDLYGLRYAEFVVPLVKAVQELSQQNNELKKRIEKLEAALPATNSTNLSSAASKNITVTDASLGQNIPNPFNNTTTINYTLPHQYSTAKIVVTDNTGRNIKEVIVSGSGSGNVNLNTSALASGTYHYSLYIGDKLIGTKQMVRLK